MSVTTDYSLSRDVTKRIKQCLGEQAYLCSGDGYPLREETSSGEFSLATEKEIYIYVNKPISTGINGSTLGDPGTRYEIGFQISGDGVFLLTFNKIPRVCFFTDRVPGVSPDPEITSLVYLNIEKPSTFTLEDRENATSSFPVFDFLSEAGIVGTKNIDEFFNEKADQARSKQCIPNLIQWENLRHINFSGWEKLTNLNGIHYAKSLTSLNLEKCSNLRQIEDLHECHVLEHLNLLGCIELESLSGLRGTKLKCLELSLPNRLTLLNFEEISHIAEHLKYLRLINIHALEHVDFLKKSHQLKILELPQCHNLENLDGVSELNCLEELNLSGCTKLDSLKPLSGLCNLKVLSAFSCHGLRNLEGIGGCGNLEEIDLSRCNSLIDLNGIECCKKVEKLNFHGSAFLKDLRPLKELENLRELEYDDPSVKAEILVSVGMEDADFIEDRMKDDFEILSKNSTPEPFVRLLSKAYGYHAKNPKGETSEEKELVTLNWVQAIDRIISFMLGFEASEESTWKALLDAVSNCPEENQAKFLSVLLDKLDQKKTVYLIRPLLRTLSGLPDSLTNWANQEVDRFLSSHSTNFLRDFGPSICLFYAQMKRESKVSEWLEKLTEPSVPRWRDRIYLALAKWEMERGDVENPCLRLKEMNQGSEKDELLELLALHLAKEKPLEAGELLDQISEEWRQLSLSEELVKVPNFTEPAENAYRLLLHMEREPEKLADWVVALLQNNPGNQLAKQLARRFGPQMQENRQLKNIFNEFTDHAALRDVTRKKDIDTFMALIDQNPDRLKSIFLSGLLLEMKREDMIKQEDLEDVFNQFGQVTTEGV